MGTAMNLYNEHLEKNPNNAAFHKRLISIYKEDGNYIEATKALSSYLEKFCSDSEGWLEMAELQLYLSTNPLSKNNNSYTNRIPHAIFCMEELLLLQPNNAAFHTRMSDLLCRNTVELGLPSFTNHTQFINNNTSPSSSSSLVYKQYKAMDIKHEDYDQLIYTLRNARLHASEGVRLTNKLNLYSLMSLADSCYLHYCSKLKQPFLVQGRLLLGYELNTMVTILKDYYNTIINGNNSLTITPNNPTLNSSSNTNTNTNMNQGMIDDDDIKLHNLAVTYINKLIQQINSSSSSSIIKNTKDTITVGNDISNAVSIHNIYTSVELENLLSSHKAINVILELQKQHMNY